MTPSKNAFSKASDFLRRREFRPFHDFTVLLGDIV
ncbi:hypothetical protein DFR29_10413 [Tahibacter aquaticus]|uniref:Uncharacterized protein n=1 Tax=Tahibacter aquaticus TaxID=520092 RepID=A0A4R6Z1X5_9GAMM|nr:hypothetical protein DFR29_10413 [Tahibacter aquaticus]